MMTRCWILAVTCFAALAFGAFAEILEFGLGAQNTVLEFCFLGGELLQFLLQFAGIGGLGFGGVLVAHLIF